MSHDAINCLNCNHSVNYGCEQSIEEIEFEKSIFNACVNGDLEKVKKFISQKGKSIVNNQDKNGYAPLHYASRNNHFEICKYLLESGANVNLKTKSCKSTALHRAAFIGNYDIVKLLIDYNSDPRESDCDGKTPLHKCVEQFLIKNDEKYIQILKILVENHPDVVHQRNNFGQSPLEIFPDLNKILK